MIATIHALLDEIKVSWEKNILDIKKKPKKPIRIKKLIKNNA